MYSPPKDVHDDFFGDEEEQELGLDQGKNPDDCKRRFTDLPCLCGFLICLVAWISLYTYAVNKGSLALYQGLPDATGQVCGVSPGVANMPYLYFCKDANGDISQSNSICVDMCRDTDGGSYSCPLDSESMVYPTEPLGGMLCVPKNMDEQIGQKVGEFTSSYGLLSLERLATSLGELLRAWPPLFLAALASIGFAFCYMLFLDKLAGCITMAALGAAIMMLLFIGGSMLWDGLSGNGHDRIPGTGDQAWDCAIAILCGCLALFLACVLMATGQSVRKAIKNIKAASAFVREVPIMMFDAIWMLIVRSSLWFTCATGFLYLVSLHLLNAQESIGWLLAFYIFMWVWMMEIVMAVGSFTASYVAQEWFFIAGEDGGPMPGCAPCRAICVGMFYHAGTFALGSFAIVTTGFWRRLFAVFESAVGNHTCCGRLISQCCGCCLNVYEQYLRYWTRLAYADVAINSNNYCTAAHQTVSVCDESEQELTTLVGAMNICTAGGLIANAILGAFVAHVVVRMNPTYSDPESEHYVQDPLVMDIVAAILSVMISIPFYTVFDMASDTFVFCLAIQEQRDKSTPLGELMFELDKDVRSCTQRSCDFSGKADRGPQGRKDSARSLFGPMQHQNQHEEVLALISVEATMGRKTRREREQGRRGQGQQGDESYAMMGEGFEGLGH